jgi:hypothetical protein
MLFGGGFTVSASWQLVTFDVGSFPQFLWYLVLLVVGAFLFLKGGKIIHGPLSSWLKLRAEMLPIGQAPRTPLVLMGLSIPKNAASIAEYKALTLDQACADRRKIDTVLFSWQQNLRVLKWHHGIVRHVYMICTNDSKDQFDEFTDMVRRIYANSGEEAPMIERFPQFVERADLEDARRKTTEALDAATKFLGIPHREASVDITSMTVMFSVGAALALVNSEAGMTYVETDPPFVLQGFSARGNVAILGA